MSKKSRLILQIVLLSTVVLGVSFYIFSGPTWAGTSCATGSKIKLKNESSNPIGFLSVGVEGVGSNLGQYNTVGKCLSGDEAKIKTLPPDTSSYDTIVALYYNKAQTTAEVEKHVPQSGGAISLGGSKDHLYRINTDLAITADLTGSHTGVIFVDGNLDIRANITYGSPTTGLVFVVKGDVFVQKPVTQVNAFIVTYGTFCSATNETICDTDSSLFGINGGLIALDPAKKPLFSRNNSDNAKPSEIIIFQPKYLAILKDVFSREEIFWKEIQ